VHSLARIYVAEPGDDALIEQQRLGALPTADEDPLQVGCGETVSERLGAEAGKPRVIIKSTRFYEVHEAEAAGVEKRDLRPAVCLEHNVGVTGVSRRRQGEFATLMRSAALYLEPTRHAQVDQERQLAVEGEEKILAAPTQSLDARACKSLDKTVRQREPQIWPARLDPRQTMTS
jgi:hypothetical protein